MKIVRFSKKLLCAVLISCMLAGSPLCAYLDTQGVQDVKASSVVGTTALLEVLLAAFGVTVSAVALDNLADSFSDWLSDNGSSESLSAWAKASSMSLVTVTAPLLTDVATWITEKFGDLNSGVVSSRNNNNLYSFGKQELTSFETALIGKCHGLYPSMYYVYETDMQYVNEYLCRYVPCDSNTVGVVHNNGVRFYSLGIDGDTLTKTNYTEYHWFMNIYNYSFRQTSTSSVSDVSYDDYHSMSLNIPFVRVNVDNFDSSTYSLSTLLSMSTFYANFDSIPDAYTSYGGYDSINVDALKNMILTPSIISSIMSAVKGAVASNKTEDEEGNVVWSDAIAQAISDAYAAGLADAKAQQGQLEDDVKEEERTTAITGWLSKIYDGILAIPSLVVNAWQGSWLNDILDGIVEFMQSILTGILSIPSAIVDAWEGSWLQVRLEHTVIFLEDILDGILSIPSAVVDAWENSWLKERLDRTVLFLEDISSNVRDIAQSLTQESSPDVFTVSLSSLFPFCIPFDLYDMLSVLCAEPQAPRFEWRFPNGIGETESLTIDLSKFDSVAQIVRAMEIIFFSVGLALKTRDLIRG